MKIFTANVGVNSGKDGGFYSPLFRDGMFEFIPIPDFQPPRGSLYYRDLKSPNNGNDLLQYIPSGLHEVACQNNPEFERMTYCDIWSGRGWNLHQIDPDDVLLFIAHPRVWQGGKPLEEHGFYLIGGLHIEQVDTSGEPLQGEDAERFSQNAGFISCEEFGYEGLMFFAGDESSRRFNKAVPLNRKNCDQVFRDAKGQPYDWAKQSGSEIRNIGSYTRTCRCVLDTSDPAQARRAATLREWIAQHSGEHDAELVTSS